MKEPALVWLGTAWDLELLQELWSLHWNPWSHQLAFHLRSRSLEFRRNLVNSIDEDFVNFNDWSIRNWYSSHDWLCLDHRLNLKHYCWFGLVGFSMFNRELCMSVSSFSMTKAYLEILVACMLRCVIGALCCIINLMVTCLLYIPKFNKFYYLFNKSTYLSSKYL